MSFRKLPNELMYQIISNLDYLSDLSAMAQTCRFFNAVATQALYSQVPRFEEEELEIMVKNNCLEALHSLIIGHKANLDMNLLSRIAARFGKIEIMRFLVEIEPTCVKGQEGESSESAHPPLLCAIINEYFDIADFLLSKGATLQVDPVSNLYPLDEAVRKSNLSAVKYIINRKLCDDLNLPSEQTPLTSAIYERKWDIAIYLLQLGADLYPIPQGSYGDHPTLIRLDSLWQASVGDLSDARRAVFTQLLDKGAYPNFADTDYWALLASKSDPELVLLAMEKLNVGTKVESREKYLCQLILTIKSGNEQALRGLLVDAYIPWAESLVLDSTPWPLSPLALACIDWQGLHVGCLDVLLEFFSNRLMPKDFEALLLSVCQRACEKKSLAACHHLLGRYPLRQHFVELEEFRYQMRCCPPREDFIRLLHDYNLDCYMDDSELKEITHIYEFGNARTVQIWFDILKRRNLFVKGNDSSFFFTIPPSIWMIGHFKLLLDYFKIELCPSEPRHQEYLEYYVSFGSIEIIPLFLDYGFDVNMSYLSDIDVKRSPMLVQACEYTGLGDKSDLVRLLLDRGASVDAVDEAGVTALYYATRECSTNIVKILLDRGANPIFKLTGDIDPFEFVDLHITPLEMAAMKGGKEIMAMILDAMTARNLKFDDFPALIQNCPRDDTRKLLTQYYWRHVYVN